MKKLNYSLLVMIVALVMAACQPQVAEKVAPDLDALKAKLQQMEDTYAEGENTKNVDMVMEYYADDAAGYPQNEPKVIGKDAIKARSAAQMAKDTTGNTVKFIVEEVIADGDLVVEIGSSVTTSPDGSTVTGKYFSVFEQRDGKLVCIRDMWNADKKTDNDEDEMEDAD